ncbi:hypothetical protein HS7_20230 [Sulfolobales archaeon HS-7]|nr:hypothetical protein HS7_20230 [Sulfolobales archaeon HS-7]
MPRKRNSSKQEAKRTRKKKEIDIDDLLNEYLEEIIKELSLENLNLSHDEYIEILKEPFASAVGDVSTKPKVKTIINRFTNRLDDLLDLVSIRILELREKLDEKQLEFVIFHLKNGIKMYAPFLYSEAIKVGRNDLIDYLRNSWSKYGIRTPVKCPKCGFEAIMPDLICKICGYTVSEKYVKEQLKVIDNLYELKRTDPEKFSEIIKSRHIYIVNNLIITEAEIRQSREQIFYEIDLTESDIKSVLKG